MLQLRSPGSRAAWAAAIASAVVVLPIVVHVVDDVQEDALARLGLGTLGVAAFIGTALVVQVLAALACTRERRSGYAVVLVVSAGWLLSVLAEHAGAFTAGEFREGFVSRAAVWAIVLLQAVALLSALVAMRSTRRTSFSGTGSYSGGGSYGS